jgi:hypothetical protein
MATLSSPWRGSPARGDPRQEKKRPLQGTYPRYRPLCREIPGSDATSRDIWRDLSISTNMGSSGQIRAPAPRDPGIYANIWRYGPISGDIWQDPEIRGKIWRYGARSRDIRRDLPLSAKMSRYRQTGAHNAAYPEISGDIWRYGGIFPQYTPIGAYLGSYGEIAPPSPVSRNRSGFLHCAEPPLRLSLPPRRGIGIEPGASAPGKRSPHISGSPGRARAADLGDRKLPASLRDFWE